MGTNPMIVDTDRDFIPDNYDPLPTTNNFIVIVIMGILIGTLRVWSYGYFRNWRKDVIVFGLSNLGGTHILTVPEKFGREISVEMFSSALTGVHMITSELVGPRDLMVMKDGVSIILSQGRYTRMWVLAKKTYPRLIKNLVAFQRFLEKKYSEILSLAVISSEDIEPIRKEVMLFLQKQG